MENTFSKAAAKNPQRPLKVFFSYSQRDQELLRQLKSHLSDLRRRNIIEPWDDSRILPGEEWDERIKIELEAADIILLLVSADFMATDYIWDVEIKTALSRHNNQAARVIPIIARQCNWQNASFAKLNALPVKGVPVTTLAEKDWDTAWTEVAKGIERVIKEFNN